MFSGIVKGCFRVSQIKKKSNNILEFSVELSSDLISGLAIGASVAINGTCLTVVYIQHHDVWFDAIEETLNKTNLKNLDIGSVVNVERSTKWGEEIGGHLLSGHISEEIQIKKIIRKEQQSIFAFHLSSNCKKYLFKKGYVALDGVSLTIAEIDENEDLFFCHLIPETLRTTTFGLKEEGDYVNIEFDSQTLAIVDTLQRLFKSGLPHISLEQKQEIADLAKKSLG